MKGKRYWDDFPQKPIVKGGDSREEKRNGQQINKK